MFKSLKLCIEKQNKIANFRLTILEHEETLILEYRFDYWNTSLPDKYVYCLGTQRFFKIYNSMGWLHWLRFSKVALG